MEKISKINVAGVEYEIADETARQGSITEKQVQGLIDGLIDDTKVSSESVWSSENIVNRLFPKISKTGTSVSFLPLVGFPLEIEYEYAVKQEGSGDPSPTNIRPIIGREELFFDMFDEMDEYDNYYYPDTPFYYGKINWTAGVVENKGSLITLTGEEDWKFYSATNTKLSYFYADLDITRAISSGVCSHYANNYNLKTRNNVGYGFDYSIEDAVRIMFRPDLTTIPDLTAWKSFLAEQNANGTPVHIAYVTNPIVENIGEMPLVAKYPGLHTIYNNWDSEPDESCTMTVNCIGDPLAIQKQLEEAIISLGGNI